MEKTKEKRKETKEKNQHLKFVVQKIMHLFPPLILRSNYLRRLLTLIDLSNAEWIKETRKNENINHELKERIERKKKTKDKCFYLSALCIPFRSYWGLNTGSSPHRHRPNPLRDRFFLLLSIELNSYANFVHWLFCLACFCLKIVHIGSLSMVV